MNNKVWIRADGSSKIGLGHLVRCMALANMLKTEFDIRFACKEAPKSFMTDAQHQGFTFIKIEREEDFFSHLNDNDIVVLDHYDLDTRYQKQIKGSGCKLVCIDDLHDKEFFADLIINHAPGIKATDYKAQIFTQFALGPDYALLRPAFLEQARKKRKVEEIETVLICFGGADYKNLTQRTLKAVLEYPEFKSVIVITGAAYEHEEKLKKVLNHSYIIKYYHAIDENNMAALMAIADVAIVPASGILLEALACGCKVVSGMYSDNQKFLFDEYKELGAFYSAEDFSEENVVYGLNNVMREKFISERYLDGRSHSRLLKLFKQLQKEGQVLLRKVEEKDLLKTYEWARDPEIRKFFFNQEAIGLTEHKKWFNHKLQDQNCFYYLGLISNKAFGSIRFDIQDHGTYVSYLIDPKYQNRGLGSIMLKKGLHLFVNSTEGQQLTICAEVFLKNRASARIFEKLGFIKELSSSNDDTVMFKKLPKN